MVWIESHQNLADHPKTRKLARILSISKPTVIGHLHCFWWWALDYADDGDLSRFDALDIAIGAEWDGDPDTFVMAMVQAGFIDDGDTLMIHDWEDYAGKLINRRRANAKRMKEARAAQSRDEIDSELDTCDARAGHAQRTQRARAERPDRTRPDQTNQRERGADAPAPAKPQKGTRLPDDFAVTDDMRSWARSEGATDRLIDSETDKFRDYWPTQPGQKGVKLNWELTWKNWMRRGIESAPAGLRVIKSNESPFAGRGYDPYRSLSPEEFAEYERQLAEAKAWTEAMARKQEQERRGA